MALEILSRGFLRRRRFSLAASYVGQPALQDSAADAAVKIAAQAGGPGAEGGGRGHAEGRRRPASAARPATRAKQLLGQAQAGSK